MSRSQTPSQQPQFGFQQQQGFTHTPSPTMQNQSTLRLPLTGLALWPPSCAGSATSPASVSQQSGSAPFSWKQPLHGAQEAAPAAEDLRRLRPPLRMAAQMGA